MTHTKGFTLRLLTKTLVLSTLSFAAVTVGTLAHAQTTTSTSSNYSNSNTDSNYTLYGPGASYVGLNAGRSNYSVGSGAGPFPFDRKDKAYNVYGGSYFNNNLGVELGYTNFGKINRAGGSTKAEGINLSLVGRAPLNNSFNLLGKIGTTYSRTNVSSSPASGVTAGSERGFGLSYGIGAEYVFTPQWSAVLQYDEHNVKFAGGGRERIDATTVGVRYRF